MSRRKAPCPAHRSSPSSPSLPSPSSSPSIQQSLNATHRPPSYSDGALTSPSNRGASSPAITKEVNRAPHRCGKCSLTYRLCQCPPNLPTESVHTILSNPRNAPEFPNIYIRHLCVFAYHPHLRWTEHVQLIDFNYSYIPPFEGWYAAYIHIESPAEPKRVPFSIHPMLPCTLHYADTSISKGFLSKDGHLYLSQPAAPPHDGADFDHDQYRTYTHVRVTSCLAKDEIQNGTRGYVHGYQSKLPNNGRAVSHIIAFDSSPSKATNSDMCDVCLFPQTIDGHPELVRVSVHDIKMYAPHLLQEAVTRFRRRHTRQEAAHVTRYLTALFREIRRNDDHVRYIQQKSWLVGHSILASRQQLVMLKQAFIEVFHALRAYWYSVNQTDQHPELHPHCEEKNSDDAAT